MTAPDHTTAPTRRDFLALSGATAGLASLGIQARAQNAVEIDADAVLNTDHATDVLVIGGGMAGLFAAVKAHDAGAATMIVSKGRLGSSGLTPSARGSSSSIPRRRQTRRVRVHRDVLQAEAQAHEQRHAVAR
jgi:NADPH-dependent 2,4-dienoyl-CoA reductase/sulfur reductase-like enzyme